MRIGKILFLTMGLLVASSCTLDLLEDPNAVQPDDILPSLQLNSIQRTTAVFFNASSAFGENFTRLRNGGNSLYANTNTPESYDGVWSTAYAAVLSDADALLKIADANGFARHAGITRVLQAYTLLTLVDMFGDVPFSQAFKGSANFNPAPDNQSALYDLALTTLDKAYEDLTTAPSTAAVPGYLNPVAPAINDFYYNNNYLKWRKLINSLRLKVYLNLRLTDPARATTGIAAAIADPAGLIVNQDENFVWRHGLTTADPDARHPRFIANYPAGGGNYMSNWLIWHMFHAYDATSALATVGQGDPRMRFYFYRQTNINSSNANEIRCLTESVPSHYPSSTGSAIIDNLVGGRPPMGVAPTHPTNDPTDLAWSRTFCYPTNVGYWGRDHIDPQGIPPDGLLRTAWGAYPAGGRFDANVNAGVNANIGMRGAGFQPIMMRSYVRFMLSEATLYLGTTGSARAYYETGIRNSMQDVRDWAVNGTYGTNGAAASPTEAATINTFYPAATYTTDVNNYVTAALAAFDNRLLVSADEAMNYVAREYWIALYGNGVEAYNLYRRTGKPTGMQPVVNPSPGSFPRSFWYPASSANINANINQKSDLTVRVFWDTNTTNLDF